MKSIRKPSVLWVCLPALAALMLLAAWLLLLPAAGNAAQSSLPTSSPVWIGEIRIDEAGEDLNEYFELAGAAGASLDGLTYLVIGDGAGGSGTIEAVVDLTGFVIPSDGIFLVAESSFSLPAEVNLTASLNFENSDNVTHLLVRDFSGMNGEDLDTDDDGVLDVLPWSRILDRIALVETMDGGDRVYGPPVVGPDGSSVPGHVYRCMSGWQIGSFGLEPLVDTPGTFNGACPPAISEIRIDEPGTDDNEYFELVGEPGSSLNDLTYLVIGDGAGGSGVIEAVVDLAGQTFPADAHFLAAESSFALAGDADLSAVLNFENSDNVTHLLVRDFSGADGDDLDTNDDGILDSTPWSEIVDLIALVLEPNPPVGTEFHYGPPAVGPDEGFVPGQVYNCPDLSGWRIGDFDYDPLTDTPGVLNSSCDQKYNDVVVAKTGPINVEAGETFAYRITVQNLASTVAPGVVLTDTLPAGVTYVSHDSGSLPANPGAGVYVWNLGDVGGSISQTFQLTVTVDGDLAMGTILTNRVVVSTSLPGEEKGNNQAAWEALVGVFRIHDIQGASHLSPLAGRMVADVEGIVTASANNGFYMQDPAPDDDPATSEGIFVYTALTPSAAVGDLVEVTGTVAEYYPGGESSGSLPITQLAAPSIIFVGTASLPEPAIIGKGGRMPPATVIENDADGDVLAANVFDPPEDGIDFYESLESMLLQVNDAQTVGPTNLYGELPVVADGGANAELMTPRGGIVVRPDDFNPERILLDDAFTEMPEAPVGARFGGPITGVLSYSFGNFKLLPSAALPEFTGGVISETTSLQPSDHRITVTTFNVENLDPNPLDGDDDMAAFGGLARQIVEFMNSPDVIGLQEVQDDSGEIDDGTVSADLTYATLIDAIAVAGGPAYDFREIAPLDKQEGGAPGGNIRVGFLFRTDRAVEFVDRPSGDAATAVAVVAGASGPELSFSPGRIDPTNPAFEDSRRPLAGEFLVDGRKLFVVVNHFNSKGGDTGLFQRYQPPVLSSEVQRLLQAQAVNDFVDGILTLDPDAYVVVMGDMNDFQFSAPLEALMAGGVLTDTMYVLPVEERYTYVYEGNSQALDHILVSPGLFKQLSGVDVVHLNAEFPVLNRPTDHDPVVAGFAFEKVRLYLPLLSGGIIP